MPTTADLAHRLRVSVGDLVRSTRSADRLSPVAAGVLDLLRRHGPATTADLAALRRVRHQSMAAIVAELAQRGDVAAEPHPGDRRKKLLALTETGRGALIRDAEQREGAIADAMTQALSPADLDAVARGLDAIDRITAALDQHSGGDFSTGAW